MNIGYMGMLRFGNLTQLMDSIRSLWHHISTTYELDASIKSDLVTHYLDYSDNEKAAVVFGMGIKNDELPGFYYIMINRRPNLISVYCSGEGEYSMGFVVADVTPIKYTKSIFHDERDRRGLTRFICDMAADKRPHKYFDLGYVPANLIDKSSYGLPFKSHIIREVLMPTYKEAFSYLNCRLYVADPNKLNTEINCSGKYASQCYFDEGRCVLQIALKIDQRVGTSKYDLFCVLHMKHKDKEVKVARTYNSDYAKLTRFVYEDDKIFHTLPTLIKCAEVKYKK